MTIEVQHVWSPLFRTIDSRRRGTLLTTTIITNWCHLLTTRKVINSIQNIFISHDFDRFLQGSTENSMFMWVFCRHFSITKVINNNISYQSVYYGVQRQWWVLSVRINKFKSIFNCLVERVNRSYAILRPQINAWWMCEHKSVWFRDLWTKKKERKMKRPKFSWSALYSSDSIFSVLFFSISMECAWKEAIFQVLFMFNSCNI